MAQVTLGDVNIYKQSIEFIPMNKSSSLTKFRPKTQTYFYSEFNSLVTKSPATSSKNHSLIVSIPKIIHMTETDETENKRLLDFKVSNVGI